MTVRALFAALLSALLAACSGSQDPPPTNQTAALTGEIFRNEVATARAQLGRNEWTQARERLAGVVESVGAADPVGAEARTLLASVAFELGDYPLAIRSAGEVPAASPFRASALESQGFAQLFSCQFDDAVGTFYQLGPTDPARSRVWLGVAYAWTGADDNARRELDGVVNDYATSEHAANARFYLAQLAVWGNRNAAAQRERETLVRGSPEYLGTLDQRARNWLDRRTHLMRAYFTFDTMSRLEALAHEPAAPEHAQLAQSALTLLQSAAGTCATQVARLVAARLHPAPPPAAVADRDDDGIPDRTDRCPDQPETRNGVADSDGCPEDTAAFEIAGNQIRLRGAAAFSFAPGEDRLLPDARPLVDQLAALLRSPEYAWIRRIRLEGHTDDRGESTANLDLSQRRVQAIAAALVSRSIVRERLEFVGYGSSRPIDFGTSDEARARNRRVEIVIIDPSMFGGVREGGGGP